MKTPVAYGGRLVDMMRQTMSATRLGVEYELFAQSIGCETFQDEIIVKTDEQSEALAKWWRDHT